VPFSKLTAEPASFQPVGRRAGVQWAGGSIQYSVRNGQGFHSNETRAGESRVTGNLRPPLKANRIIHFFQKKQTTYVKVPEGRHLCSPAGQRPIKLHRSGTKVFFVEKNAPVFASGRALRGRSAVGFSFGGFVGKRKVSLLTELKIASIFSTQSHPNHSFQK